MANVFNGTTWILDTTGVINTYPLYVKTIKLIAEAAAGGENILIFDPLTGKALYEEVCPGPNFSSSEVQETWWLNGMNLSSLGGIAGAKLYINLG